MLAPPTVCLWNRHLNCSLNSLRGVIQGIKFGSITRVGKGDRSLDYGSSLTGRPSHNPCSITGKASPATASRREAKWRTGTLIVIIMRITILVKKKISRYNSHNNINISRYNSHNNINISSNNSDSSGCLAFEGCRLKFHGFGVLRLRQAHGIKTRAVAVARVVGI